MNSQFEIPDPIAQMPANPAVLSALTERHRFSASYLERRTQAHQDLIDAQLGRLGIVLAMSTPMEMDPAPIFVTDEAPKSYSTDSFDAKYAKVRSRPIRKFEHDSAFVNELFLKLGPTNQLRSREGYDAGIELGRVVHLLETDFAALPVSEQLPERRLTETLVREELALLWRPTTPNKFANNPHKAFMLDLSDPNLFTEEQIATLPEQDRWKVIGSRLSDEAANMFQAIAESPTAQLSERLTADCRMTDMRIRGLRIHVGISTNSRTQRQELYEQIATLNNEYMERLADVWDRKATRIMVQNGLLFELFVVGQERDELINNQEVDKLIRLALPREDRVHEDIPGYYDHDNMLVNMSVDAVAEDTGGNFVRAFQVKAMQQSRFNELEAHRITTIGKRAYSPYRADMRFTDDYPTVSRHGIDLSVIDGTRKVAS